jgi:TDP-4-amino-4,6-dideoxy-D-glucose deaminase
LGVTSIENTSLIIAVAEEISARPFLAASELCRRFAVSKHELKAIYAAIRASPEVRKNFNSSPFFYLIKVLENLSKDRSRTLQILRAKSPQPLLETLELFISGHCNVNCTFCYRRGRDYGEQHILSSAEFVAIVNEFADLGGKIMDVSGGLEPLLSPAICDVLRTGVERGLRTNLYTIGNALHSPKFSTLLTSLSQIRVSFTAHDKTSYRRMMGVDQFDRVTANIRTLVQLKTRCHSSVRIGTSHVVTPENFRDIPKAIECAMDLGVDFFDLRSVSVSASPDYRPNQRADLREILAAVRHRQANCEYGQLKISIADAFNVIATPESDPMPNVDHDLIKMLVHYRVTVTPAGKVFPLNILGQPTHEDERFLLGKVGANRRLAAAMTGKKDIPLQPDLLLPHDKSLILALSKLKNDLAFGIGLEESPFAA